MSLKALQDEFIAAIRQPALPCPDGVPERRMAVYRELFFNNVSGFVDNAFPVLKSLYTREDWLTLVRQFFCEHDCQNPLFVGIAGEFLLFLQQRRPAPADPVFMLELAHYEWLELVVAIAQQSPNERPFEPAAASHESVLMLPLRLASHARVAQYHFEVQKISIDFQPSSPCQQPQFFCIYRDRNDEVRFLQLNPLTAQAMALLDAEPGLDFNTLVQRLAAWYPRYRSDELQGGLSHLIEQMAAKGVLVQHLQ